MNHGDTEGTELHREKEESEPIEDLSQYPLCNSVPSVSPWLLFFSTITFFVNAHRRETGKVIVHRVIGLSLGNCLCGAGLTNISSLRDCGTDV